MVLPEGIIEHGINGEIDRLTLLGKIEKSPSSSRTRELISSSYKYGLTSGSYKAQILKVTDDGRTLITSSAPPNEIKEKQFQLAVKQFEHFDNLYEKLKNQRLPDDTVIGSELVRSGISADDREKAAELFVANIRYIGMVEQIAGNDYVRAIEQVSQQASSVPEVALQERVETNVNEGTEPQPTGETRPTPEGNGSADVETKRPDLHIDIQVHIDATASAEQIDFIFASMAKHLYGLKS